MGNKINKFIFKLGYFVTFITVVSIYFLSQATENSAKFEKYYQLIFFTSIIGIISLFIIVLFYLFKILILFKKKTPGSSLSLNLLIRTLAVAFIPISLISFFSIKFLSYEFQTSFDKGINEALNNSLILSKKTLDMRALQALKNTNIIAKVIAPLEYYQLQYQLEKIRDNVKAYELTVFDEKGFIQAYASLNRENIIPKIPSHNDFLRIEDKGSFFNIESIKDGFQIKVLSIINKPGNAHYYLQSRYQIPDSISQLADQVNKTITERDKFNYLKPKINNSFTIVLFMVMLLGILLLILTSVALANYMVKPIKEVIQETIKVSKGNLSSHIKTSRKDDFGTLMRAFNNMVASLRSATELAVKSKKEVDNERAYLATIIESINSAVITLDYKNRLLTYNLQAEKLLNCKLNDAVFLEINELGLELTNYKEFINQVSNEKIINKKEIEIAITSENKNNQLIARRTKLPSTDKNSGGSVIIFDDFTKYWERQKEAAWEEVARRLAHEIKNPLTPILLAAERINYKVTDLPDKEQEILNRSIEVIIKQVKSMKNMVDDFSDYAKPSDSKKSKIHLNSLIKDVLELYIDHFDRFTFTANFLTEQDEIIGNNNQLRQVIHNLLKNAMEAIPQEEKGLINLTTEKEESEIIIKIVDNGIGLKENHENLFEPYISSKEKGTGLGLAIVRKTINEHNGTITIQNNPDKGAMIIIKIPLV